MAQTAYAYTSSSRAAAAIAMYAARPTVDKSTELRNVRWTVDGGPVRMVHTHTPSHQRAPPTSCPICMEPFDEGVGLTERRPFNCQLTRHSLCALCDDELLRRCDDRCPMCRAPRSLASSLVHVFLITHSEDTPQEPTTHIAVGLRDRAVLDADRSSTDASTLALLHGLVNVPTVSLEVFRRHRDILRRI